MARVEVLSGPERRRRWSEEQKRAIVAAAFAPGPSFRGRASGGYLFQSALSVAAGVCRGPARVF
ncbi:MAG: transposase [Rhodospirillales bacterium]|nr:transposase [Rhodospirillales bacterium]